MEEITREVPVVEVEDVGKEKGIGRLEPVYVKSMELSSLIDVQEVSNELRAGNIIVLDIGTLMNQDPAELKRAIDQLKGICRAIGGDIGRLTESKVIATPRFIHIQFKGA
jgi:hypothetical protein